MIMIRVIRVDFRGYFLRFRVWLVFFILERFSFYSCFLRRY